MLVAAWSQAHAQPPAPRTDIRGVRAGMPFHEAAAVLTPQCAGPLNRVPDRRTLPDGRPVPGFIVHCELRDRTGSVSVAVASERLDNRVISVTHLLAVARPCAALTDEIARSYAGAIVAQQPYAERFTLSSGQINEAQGTRFALRRGDASAPAGSTVELTLVCSWNGEVRTQNLNSVDRQLAAQNLAQQPAETRPAPVPAGARRDLAGVELGMAQEAAWNGLRAWCARANGRVEDWRGGASGPAFGCVIGPVDVVRGASALVQVFGPLRPGRRVEKIVYWYPAGNRPCREHVQNFLAQYPGAGVRGRMDEESGGPLQVPGVAQAEIFCASIAGNRITIEFEDRAIRDANDRDATPDPSAPRLPRF